MVLLNLCTPANFSTDVACLKLARSHHFWLVWLIQLMETNIQLFLNHLYVSGHWRMTRDQGQLLFSQHCFIFYQEAYSNSFLVLYLKSEDQGLNGFLLVSNTESVLVGIYSRQFAAEYLKAPHGGQKSIFPLVNRPIKFNQVPEGAVTWKLKTTTT